MFQVCLCVAKPQRKIIMLLVLFESLDSYKANLSLAYLLNL